VNHPPDRPQLASPGNGTSPSFSDPVTLVWYDLGDWGANCSGNNNHCAVYFDTANPPQTQIDWLGEGETSKLLNDVGLNNGATYHWQVTATSCKGAHTRRAWMA
jgi:hypothetical protein